MSTNTHSEKLSFQAEVKQILQMVVHSLYSNKEIFLRELISNASDAIDKLRFEALSDSQLFEQSSDLNIWVEFDKEASILTVRDNGIGMSRDEVISNLGTIAKSGTREFLSKLTGDQQKDAHLIGQFGVGFYASFMVADKVTVLTRRAGLSKEHGVKWESTGDGEYVIENIDREQRGTEVILHLKKEEDEYLNQWRLRNIITKYSDHIAVPVLMNKMTDDGKATAEWERVNRATALWALPKNTITKEQYDEFYKFIAHDYENPLAYTHNKIESGMVDYICLLFIPQHATMDLWQRESTHGLKLYVQRVFIMDQVQQFLPNYLRFMRGVLDTNALPLNISREILQDHPVIFKLRHALVRHSLELLEKLSVDEPEKYKIFWKEFGTILKEGTAEDFSNRDRVAKLLRFSSTKAESDEQTVSLADYVSRMKPAQKKIYYLTADNIASAKSSPHLEIFRKRDIEVLLLTDRIDEWVVGHLPEFDKKPLQSVAKGDLPLDEIDQSEETKKEEKKEAAQKETFDQLLKAMQGVLTDKVQEVRLSHRLVDSPVCLVRDQNALGPQMERLLKASGQAVAETKPIMELNPNHVLIQKLQNGADLSTLSEWTHLLFEQALLAEGSALPDPALFVKRMNALWTKQI